MTARPFKQVQQDVLICDENARSQTAPTVEEISAHLQFLQIRTSELGSIHCSASDGGSDQCSIPNAQFSAEVNVGLRVVRPMHRRGIEHWSDPDRAFCQVIFRKP